MASCDFLRGTDYCKAKKDYISYDTYRSVCYDTYYASKCPNYIYARERGDCYLATAMCQILGKPDNCMELETLRQFRDDVLLESDSGRSLLKQYYETAPAIAKRLEASNSRNTIAHEMLTSYISKIVNMIKDKENQSAIDRYYDMVQFVNAECK